LHPAETLERKLTDNAVKGYITALVDRKPSKIAQAFSRALDESMFFPPPATLREMAGQTTMTGDAAAAEAKAELFRIVAAMPWRAWSEAERAPDCTAPPRDR
jgi:hypothetical protein